jgi:integrase
MASIKKTTTKSGETRYRVRWRLDGQLVEKWYPTLQAARAAKTRAEADALDGVSFHPGSGTKHLNAYFAEWVPARLVRGKGLAPSTRAGYERLWRRNVKETLGRKQLRAVTPEGVRNWYGELVAESGQDQAAKSYRLVRAVLASAEADGVIRVNPCKLRGAGQERYAERPMVATSLVLDLADAIEPRYRALVMLAGFAGLRTGENLGLRRCDIDLLHSEVAVIRQAQEIPGAGRVVCAPKSEAGQRVVALPRFLSDALEVHLAAFVDVDREAVVFTGPEGTPLRRATLSRAWRTAVITTSAPEDLRLHDLRHHAATLTARMPGITTKELMARIGHASPRAALIYQHATADRDRAIASFLDDQMATVERPVLAAVVGLEASTRGAGVGLG